VNSFMDLQASLRPPCSFERCTARHDVKRTGVSNTSSTISAFREEIASRGPIQRHSRNPPEKPIPETPDNPRVLHIVGLRETCSSCPSARTSRGENISFFCVPSDPLFASSELRFGPELCHNYDGRGGVDKHSRLSLHVTLFPSSISVMESRRV